MENSYNSESARSNELATELSIYQRRFASLNEQYHFERSERNEEAKKGAYVISLLTSELKIARATVQEVERGQANLLQFNVTLKSLLRKTKMDSIQLSPSAVAVAEASAAESLESAKITTKQLEEQHLELESLRRDREEWQYQKGALLREIKILRPIDRSLAELAADLKVLKCKEKSRSILHDDDNIAYQAPLPLPHTRSDLNTEESRGYRDRYSRASNLNANSPGYMGSRSPSRSSSNRTSTPTKLSSGIIASTERTFTDLKHVSSSNNGDFSCPLSHQHASWVNLPSIPRLSLSLHEQIKKIASDLRESEFQCAELENDLTLEQNKIRGITEENENEMLRIDAYEKIQKKVLKETKQELKERELELEEMRKILDQTITSLRAAPGVQDHFFDDEISVIASNSDAQENSNGISRSRRLTYPNSARVTVCNSFDADSVSQWRKISGDSGSDSSSGPRKPLSMSKMYPRSTARAEREGKYSGRSKAARSADLRERAPSSPMRSIKTNASPHLIPDMVAFLIAQGNTDCSKLHDTEKRLFSIISELQNAQSALRISNGEYEYLVTQIETHKLKDEGRNEDFVKIESVLKRDLEFATDLIEKQNSLAMILEKKTETLMREKYLISAQLTSTHQREELGHLQLWNVLNEYSQQFSLGTLPPPSDSPSPSVCMNDLTDFARIILSALQSKKIEIARERGTEPLSGAGGISSGIRSPRRVWRGTVGAEKDPEEQCMTPTTESTDSDDSNVIEYKKGHENENDNIEYDTDININYNNIFGKDSGAELPVRKESSGINPIIKESLITNQRFHKPQDESCLTTSYKNIRLQPIEPSKLSPQKATTVPHRVPPPTLSSSSPALVTNNLMDSKSQGQVDSFVYDNKDSDIQHSLANSLKQKKINTNHTVGEGRHKTSPSSQLRSRLQNAQLSFVALRESINNNF